MAGDSSSTPAPKGGNTGTAKSSGGFLMAKIGPFPVIVYLIVAGVAVYVLVQKKKSAATTTAAPASTTDQSGTQPGQGVSGPQSQIAQYLAANASAATTNPQWEANAEAVLVGEGYPYVQIQSALNTYLAGGVLSSIQQEIVNAAIEAVGAPPSAPTTQPASTNSPTVATPPTAQPQSPQAQQTPGYTTITNPQEGSNLEAEGIPVEVQIGGAGGPIVPFKSGVQYAPGSNEVYQQSATPSGT